MASFLLQDLGGCFFALFLFVETAVFLDHGPILNLQRLHSNSCPFSFHAVNPFAFLFLEIL